MKQNNRFYAKHGEMKCRVFVHFIILCFPACCLKCKIWHKIKRLSYRKLFVSSCYYLQINSHWDLSTSPYILSSLDASWSSVKVLWVTLMSSPYTARNKLNVSLAVFLIFTRNLVSIRPVLYQAWWRRFKKPCIKLFNYSTLRQGNGARFNMRQREDSAVTVTIYYVHFGDQCSGPGVRAHPFTSSHKTHKNYYIQSYNSITF